MKDVSYHPGLDFDVKGVALRMATYESAGIYEGVNDGDGK